VNGFSRPQELEADKVGVGYLNKAGLSTEYYLQLLNVLQKKSGGKSKKASYFSTHPTNKKRIQKIRDLQISN